MMLCKRDGVGTKAPKIRKVLGTDLLPIWGGLQWLVRVDQPQIDPPSLHRLLRLSHQFFIRRASGGFGWLAFRPQELASCRVSRSGIFASSHR